MINAHEEYTRGLKSEAQVIRFLKRLNLTVVESTDNENIKDDIDCWVNGSSVSIKTQHTAMRTGNLAFEIFVEFADGRTNQSWYHTGKAEWYVFFVGHDVFKMETQKVKEYVASFGWDSKRRLTERTRREQAKIGHANRDALVGLINLEKFRKALGNDFFVLGKIYGDE